MILWLSWTMLWYFCPGWQLLAKHQVFSNGEMWDAVQLLMNEAHSKLSGLFSLDQCQRFSIHRAGDGVCHQVPRKNFDQGGLTSAVFAHQSMDFTRKQGEFYSAQHRDAAKAFLEVA